MNEKCLSGTEKRKAKREKGQKTNNFQKFESSFYNEKLELKSNHKMIFKVIII